MEGRRIYSDFIKRLLDLCFGILLLIVLIIPMIIISICIILDDGTPVIFKQIRVGRLGKCFEIYKFRTMVKNAEQIGPKATTVNDNRITKIGKKLRRTSLDELPQIINVIKGDMSFIGYRPDVYREENDYKSLKYNLRPGITGYAQVNGRSSLTADEVKYWEKRYNEEVSFNTDLKIMIKTFKSVVLKKGTN